MTKIAGSGSASRSDPLVRGMDPGIQIQIQIHPKMSWIRNTAGRIHRVKALNRTRIRMQLNVVAKSMQEMASVRKS
jgi:hypothetical protein